MKKRRISIFLLVTVFLLAPIGLMAYGHVLYDETSKEMEQQKTYSRHYVMITGDEDSGLWDAIYESAREEGEARGVYVERFGDQLAVNYDRTQLVELAVNASVDGILVNSDETEEMTACIDAAVEAGIPVATVLNDCSGSTRQCFVGANNYHIGQEYGKRIKKALKKIETDKTKKVLVLTENNSGDTSSNLILLGIRETLEQEIKVDKTVSVDAVWVDNSDSFGAEEYIRDIFLDEEQTPDILVCLSGVYTQCAYQAAVDYNQVGRVQLFGYYDSAQILDALAKNILTLTITPDTREIGRASVAALDEYRQTGYTNGYTTVDVDLITPAEAKKRLTQLEREEEQGV